MINDFFYGGRAPIAFVITHFDTPDERWWERNQYIIAQNTGIPVQSIPYACITTTQTQTGSDQSQRALRTLLQPYDTALPPFSLRLDLLSRTTACLDLAAHCGLSHHEATALVEAFSAPHRRFNVVFFGARGAGMSSVVNLLAGHPVAEVGSGVETCTLGSHSYEINMGMQQFLVWDTMGYQCMQPNRAIENAVRLICDLSRESGVDLLVFTKRPHTIDPMEVEYYRLFEEFLCEGQVPVAIVIVGLEMHDPMEEWWETNGQEVLKTFDGNVIGHACITVTCGYKNVYSKKLLESRLSVRAMLEDCVSSRSKPQAKVEGYPPNCL